MTEEKNPPNQPSSPLKHGSVLVIGGGITGIQSSLDLADAGFKVYIVERGLSIGGVMTQLDKTFPTNDCSMCILAPKLVYTGRHENIKIMTNAEITDVSGQVGDFSVKVRTHPRYVKSDKCNGCGDCVDHCPVDILSSFDEGLTNHKAIYQQFPQAIPNTFAITKRDGLSPCRVGCPAGLNVHGFVALASQEKFAEAYELIKETIPLPGSLGRICYHPCEKECNRKEIDESLSICRLRRFIADYVYDHPQTLAEYRTIRKQKQQEKGTSEEERKRGKKRKVAIIGAGPAGLTAAENLSKKGYHPTIFEAEHSPGGMLRYGVPAYRLSKEYLEKEIDMLLKEEHIIMKNNQRLGKDFSLHDLKKEGYESVFLAIGTPLSRKIKAPGCNASGIFYGIELLKTISLGHPVHLGKKIVVIGGGNVAVDVARTARRLDEKTVEIICLEEKEEMPAHPWEITEALEEGIVIHNGLGIKEFLVENGHVKGIRTQKCVAVFDKEGKFNPTFDTCTLQDFAADTVVIAIGQAVDPSTLSSEGALEITRQGTIKVDPITRQTSIKGVFAGGDAVSGPASAVEAIAAGHEAALSIDRYLHDEDLKIGREKTEQKKADIPPEASRSVLAREHPVVLSLHKRLSSFDEIEHGLTKEKALREAQRCLKCAGCSECMQCVLYCGRDAVDHQMKETTETIHVGSIIVSTGFDEYIPSEKDDYGYRQYPNVLTSIEFERMLSASGPYKGHITRISDGKPPRKIAWIQCVGSRDERCDSSYCSSVCCMYATKEAVIAKEHQPGVETHIYFMDMRAFGKGFEKYYIRAEHEYGVVYRRCRIPSVEQDPETKNLSIRYIDDDGLQEEDYDMVVLSIGLQPCKSLKDLSKILHVNLNSYGFIETHPFYQILTSQPGIYTAGAVTEPKDIPESVIQASAAAAEAAKDIADARGTEITKKKYPEERQVRDETPRIGVFICHCGINIGGIVTIKEVVEYAKTLPYVSFVDENLFTCSQDSQEKIKKKIQELNLNRVVIASCTPRTHEPLFQDTLRETGLNPHLFEMANLRDQNSWVHKSDPRSATEKAIDLVRMAVVKAYDLSPVQHLQIPILRSVLVIGGGLSGMQSALSIANQGYPVVLVEKEKKLGGHLQHIYLGVGTEKPQELLKETVEKVTTHHNIRVFTDTTVQDVSGYVGNFTTTLLSKKKNISEKIQHGVIVVATGGLAYQPVEYQYGKSKDVITQSDFEKDLFEEKHSLKELKELVMIQCIGSRNDTHPYCSRICCSQALKNALRLKEINPDSTMYVLYRDLRTFGFREQALYQKARQKGIIFIRFDTEDDITVNVNDGKLLLKTFDPILKREIHLHPDKIVLSTGIVPENNTLLAQQLKVPLSEDAFFAEAHIKLRPVDFSADGIFLCGLAHSPRFIEESILQAKATGARVATILSKEYLETKGNIARILSRNCAGCKLCVETCPYDAISFDEETKKAIVNEILCQGCGGCTVICPSGTSQQYTFTKRQILSMVDACCE